MRRLIITLLLISLILAGGWAVFHKDQIGSIQQAFQLASKQLKSLTTGNSQFAPYHTESEVIRLASLHLQGLATDASQFLSSEPFLVEIVRQFDVIAIQAADINDERAIKQFVQLVNENGLRYRLILNRSGRSTGQRASGFIYNSATVELEGSYYTVNDPDRLLKYEPLVAWFRARGTEAGEGFTFNLVNMQLDEGAPDLEIRHLDQVFRAVRNDGRGEDDVIILGVFNAGDAYFRELEYRHGLTWLISGKPTDTRQTRQLDNIVIDPIATSEYTGQSGVLDFMKQFNLTLEQALKISHHQPVWAEFSKRESSSGQQVASQTVDNY